MAANKWRNVKMYTYLWVILFLSCSDARKHRLNLKDDDRKTVSLSTFGFLTGGTLAVNVTLSGIHPQHAGANTTMFGFTLDKSKSPGLSKYMEDTSSHKKCILNNQDMENNNEGDSVESVFFKFDLQHHRLKFQRLGHNIQNLMISNVSRDLFLIQHRLHRRSAHSYSPTWLGNTRNVREAASPIDQAKNTGDVAPDSKTSGSASENGAVSSKTGPKSVPSPSAASSSSPSPPSNAVVSEDETGMNPLLAYTLVDKPDDNSYQAYFLVYIEQPEEEGLYNLYFHNCLPYQEPPVDPQINLSLEIIEDNNGNYLTAGEMPVPALYFTFSVLFFITAIAWMSVLRRSKEDVYKIHYLMSSVVFVKCLACLFHGVNMYFIQINGVHEEAWAVLWYIVYLTRGALMFVTVLLIGAGWAFIKHMLTDKEKKLFLIVIPLQVLDRVAWIIVEESEEGNVSYTTWNEIFILVDLLCCGAILFPVVWSIRHLQEASGTDGKAAINLQKLKLFRHFYILVVCYIYFTRIIVYLMKITLPFKLEWLTDLFTELAMMVFFVLTGIKFRPATDNPYLQVPQDSDDEEIEMEEVLTKTGNTENVVKVNQKSEGAENSRIKQRESSHEYD